MVDGGERLAALPVGRAHDLGMKGTGHRQRHGLHRAFRLGDLRRSLTSGQAAGDDDVAGTEEIGDLERLVVADRLAEGLDLERAPDRGCLPFRRARHRRPLAWPPRAAAPPAGPSSKLITPAKTIAVYSPRLSPAVASHAVTTSGDRARSDSSAARLVTKIAGWL